MPLLPAIHRSSAQHDPAQTSAHPTAADAAAAEASRSWKSPTGLAPMPTQRRRLDEAGHHVTPTHTEPSSVRPDRPLKPPHQRAEDMPTDPKVLQAMYVNVKLSRYAYTRNPDALPEGWATSTQLSRTMNLAMGFPEYPEGVENDFGTVIRIGSGLTAVIVVNEKDKEVRCIIGGTGAGAHVGSTAAQLHVRNPRSAGVQWVTNGGAAAGFEMPSYRQAKLLVQHLSDHLAGKDYKLSLVGHSKGGGEAIYAALSLPEGLPAFVLGTSHLSEGLVNRLPAENVRAALSLVTSAYVEGDPVAGLIPSLPFVQIRPMGVEYVIPADPAKSSGWLGAHDQYEEHWDSYMAERGIQVATVGMPGREQLQASHVAPPAG